MVTKVLLDEISDIDVYNFTEKKKRKRKEKKGDQNEIRVHNHGPSSLCGCRSYM